MVYLPPEIARRKSQQASALSQGQQAMGVTPVAQPQPPTGGGGGMALAPAPQQGAQPQAAGGQVPGSVRELIEAQQSQRQMLEARGQDLRLAQMLSRALDPAMPKAFRQLGMRQISQMLGVDPRGERAKEMINAITGLDPQSLEGIKRGIVGATDTAQPGEVTEMTRGVLSGQIPPDQLMQLASQATAPSSPGEPPGGGGQPESPMMRLGGPAISALGEEPQSPLTLAQAPGQPNQPGAPLGPRDPEPARIPFTAGQTTQVPRQDDRNISPRMRETAPELLDVLGVDLDRPYRNVDVMKGGWGRIPSDYEGQQKLASDIRGNQAGVVDTMVMAGQLHQLTRNPEALNLVNFKIPGTDTVFTLNVPSAAIQLRDFAAGLDRTLGIKTDNPRDPDFLDRWIQSIDAVAATEPAYNNALGVARTRIRTWMEETGYRVEDAAVTNARINSILVPLAFSMAAAKGQTGRFLSDRDVEAQLREIGQSASPAQFDAAIKDMVDRIYGQYETRMKAQTGGAVPISHAITPEAANSLRGAAIIPARLMRQLVASNEEQALETSRPGPGVRQEVLRQIDTEASEGRAPSSRRSLPRSGPTIEEEESGRRRLIEEDRAAVMEARGQNRRRLEIAESQEGRAARAEVQARRDKITAAFMELGRSLRTGGGAGGGGVPSMGSDQDPNAFKIASPPRRSAPTPAQAPPPYQPQGRRRRNA